MFRFLIAIALAIPVETIAVTYKIHKGWNLLGAPCNIPVSTFNKEGIVTVWRWTGYKWEVYSPYTKIIKLIKYYGLPIFNEIKALEGFWLNANSNFDLDVSSCQIYSITIGGGTTIGPPPISYSEDVSGKLKNCKNLVYNGDFEAGTDGWKIVEFTLGAKVIYRQENKNHFIRMHHDGAEDWCSISQEIASKLKKGKTYIFSYRYRTKDKVEIGIRFTDPSTISHSTALSNKYGWNHPLISDGNWHTEYFEFTVNNTHPKSNEPFLGIFFDYHNIGYVDIDDIYIVEKDKCDTNFENNSNR